MTLLTENARHSLAGVDFESFHLSTLILYVNNENKSLLVLPLLQVLDLIRNTYIHSKSEFDISKLKTMKHSIGRHNK